MLDMSIVFERTILVGYIPNLFLLPWGAEILPSFCYLRLVSVCKSLTNYTLCNSGFLFFFLPSLGTFHFWQPILLQQK
jgi:hypothetical protein